MSLLLLWLYFVYLCTFFFSDYFEHFYYFKNYVNIDFNLINPQFSSVTQSCLTFTNYPFCFLLSWTIILNKFFLMVECVVYIWMLKYLKNILLIDLTNELQLSWLRLQVFPPWNFVDIIIFIIFLFIFRFIEEKCDSSSILSTLTCKLISLKYVKDFELSPWHLKYHQEIFKCGSSFTNNAWPSLGPFVSKVREIAHILYFPRYLFPSLSPSGLVVRNLVYNASSIVMQV